MGLCHPVAPTCRLPKFPGLSHKRVLFWTHIPAAPYDAYVLIAYMACRGAFAVTLQRMAEFSVCIYTYIYIIYNIYICIYIYTYIYVCMYIYV